MRQKVQLQVELPTATACQIVLLEQHRAQTHKMDTGHGSASRMSETPASRGKVSIVAMVMTDLSSRQRAEGRVAALEG
jgi:hypothetical protein